MPAITLENPLVLPRIRRPDPSQTTDRPVRRVVQSHRQVEGAGFEVWRPFPGAISLADADPFLLLDQLGPLVNGLAEASGAPWHPHRGFETVTYVMDGEVSHHDTNGGGGVIAEGDTQWMTAGSGILHIERPPEELVATGGVFHGIQLWVNLPKAEKMTAPRYQDIGAGNVVLLSTPDGGALVRLIAGDVAGFAGPGSTHSPITMLHATVSPGAQLALPWRPDFNALVYVLSGNGTAGEARQPIGSGQLAVFGDGDSLAVTADTVQESRAPDLEVLVLGGRPIREPVYAYGPFVMNTKDEIAQAFEDFRAGRLGTVPVESA
jgi:hypothetical protein